jgi:adenylate cyclase
MNPDSVAREGGRDMHRVRQTVVVIDLVESVRLMLADEDGVIERWQRFIAAAGRCVAGRGRVVKSLGDGLLLVFDDVDQAVAAAFDMQGVIGSLNAGCASADCMLLRIGIHETDILVTEIDVFGSGVNLAARLAALGRPGDVLVSGPTRQKLATLAAWAAQDLGMCYLKHVDEPCQVFRLGLVAAGQHAEPAHKPRSLEPRVAVLPLTFDPATTPAPIFVNVVTDDLVSALARYPQLQVVSRLSVHAMGEQPAGMREMDLLLEVDYTVHGTMKQSGERLLLEIELLESGSPIWTGHFEGRLDRLLDADNTLGGRAAKALCQAVLRRQMHRLHAAALPNLPGYALLLQAMSLLHRLSASEVVRAQGILEHLSERYPRAPEVQAWFAKWHFLQIAQSRTPDRTASVRMARQHLDRALDVEPDHGLALAIEGHLHAFEDREPQVAERRLSDATRVAPNEPLAWLFLANVRATIGNSADGLVALKRAQELAPFDPMGYLATLIASVVHMAAGSADEALRFAQRSVDQNPLHLSSLIQLLFAQADVHRMEDARATARRYLELRPGASVQRFIDHHFAIESPQAQRQVATLIAVGIPR